MSSACQVLALLALCASTAFAFNKGNLAQGVYNFYGSLDADQQAELRGIISDSSSTKAEIKSQLKDFVATLSQREQKQAKAIYSQLQTAIADKVKEYQNKKLSNSARKAVNDVKAILQNDNITPIQECNQIVAKVKALSAADRSALGLPTDFAFDCSKIGQLPEDN
ncbi:SXP/RAL-2 protein [Aphelenchoides avenae]|nr:SXP/RAL-2 protein [Aphelenchus avenae]KAH7717479.1 SXP/RAL-2 protein [Aphelenchus avenae]